MSNLALTPQPLIGGASILNITTNLVSLTGDTGVTFTNDGLVFLLLVNGSTASNATIKIATLVEGQAVTSIGPVAVPVSATSQMGPWDAAYSAGFGGTAEIDFSSVTGLSCILLRPVGTK